jgi:two-component system, NtrC family, sensor kinase
MKKNICLFIFASAAVMLLANETAAQKTGQLRIDSLLAELPKAKNDTNKVNLLNDLSYTFRKINADEGIKYGEQALKLAGDINWIKGIAYANSRIGNNYMVKSDHAKAQQYLITSYSLFDKLNDKIA